VAIGFPSKEIPWASTTIGPATSDLQFHSLDLRRKSGAETARLYGVSQPTVSRIVAMHLAGRAQRAVLNKSASDP
jgi:hypothetical protein